MKIVCVVREQKSQKQGAGEQCHLAVEGKPEEKPEKWPDKQMKNEEAKDVSKGGKGQQFQMPQRERNKEQKNEHWIGETAVSIR